MKKNRFRNGIDQQQAVEDIRPTAMYAFIRASPLVAASFAGMVLAALFMDLLILAALAMAIAAWYRFLYTINIRYTVTPETITVRTGIIARRFDSLEMYRIKDYVVHQSAVMRIFGIMSVTLLTTDMTTGTLVLQGIPLSNIAEDIRGLIQRARMKNRILEIS